MVRFILHRWVFLEHRQNRATWVCSIFPVFFSLLTGSFLNIFPEVGWQTLTTMSLMNCIRSTRDMVCGWISFPVHLSMHKNFVLSISKERTETVTCHPGLHKFLLWKWCKWKPLTCLLAHIGFEILAFPCNQFGAQEPGNNDEIVDFVCTNFKSEFPIFEKVCSWIFPQYAVFQILEIFREPTLAVYILVIGGCKWWKCCSTLQISEERILWYTWR